MPQDLPLPPLSLRLHRLSVLTLALLPAPSSLVRTRNISVGSECCGPGGFNPGEDRELRKRRERHQASLSRGNQQSHLLLRRLTLRVPWHLELITLFLSFSDSTFSGKKAGAPWERGYSGLDVLPRCKQPTMHGRRNPSSHRKVNAGQFLHLGWKSR